MNEVLLSVISFVASIVSIVIGIVAIIQAKRYNDESEKINNDTKILLSSQLRKSELIEKIIVRNSPGTPGRINMAKDGLMLVKLSGYNKKDKQSILALFENLRIKKSTYDFIEKFLNSDDKTTITANFYNLAETRNNVDIQKIENKLEEYGILILISYQAKENTNVLEG